MATLSDLTDPNAVISAIEEFDEVGQSRFLEKYGFGKATAYYLTYNGQRYDSKAIAGAAIAHQHGTTPSPADFDGGKVGAAGRLESLGFTVQFEGRPPDWTRDELLLALNFYFTQEGSIDESSPDVAELSDRLRKLHIFPGHIRQNPRFRNLADVAAKLSNFLSVDPHHLGKKMSHISQSDRQVFEDFTDDRSSLGALTAAILDANESLETVGSTYEDEEIEADEGRLLYRLHRSRECNRKIVRAKKSAVLKAKGKLECEVCGFESAAVYGPEIGGLIDVHHIVPLHVAQESKTKLSDLALVCPNCHRALHAHRPFITPQELKAKRKV